MSTCEGTPHRLGLVGCGAFGTFLADTIAELPTVALAAATDSRTDAAVRLAAAHPHVAIAADLDAILADPDIDIVAITTPPSTHAALATRALNSGRHVLVEKPLAIDIAGCRQVAAAAADAGRHVAVDHLLRFAPLVTALSQLLAVEADGRRVLGPIRRFAFENDAADDHLAADHWFWDPRRSGGIFIEHGVHFFDLAAHLIGSHPVEIQATATSRPDGRTDTVCATATYLTGTTASWYHAFTHTRQSERQTLRLDVGNGECRLHGWIPLDLHLDAWTDAAGADALSAATPSIQLGGPEQHTSVTIGRNAGQASAVTTRATHHVRVGLSHRADAKQAVYTTCLRHLLTDLLHAIDTGTPTRITLDAATAAVRVAAAATEAARTRTTVPLANLSTPDEHSRWTPTTPA